MKVYVLMQDDDMTMRSSPTPIGYYVTSEEAAKDFVNNPLVWIYGKIVRVGRVESARLVHALYP